jgi:hypothetical protein
MQHVVQAYIMLLSLPWHLSRVGFPAAPLGESVERPAVEPHHGSNQDPLNCKIACAAAEPCGNAVPVCSSAAAVAGTRLC